MYSAYQRNKALQLYYQIGSVSKVIQKLGYPTRQGLYAWISQRNRPIHEKAPRRKHNNTPEHPMHPSIDLKLDTLHRCFEQGENVQLVSEEIGYSRSSIYTWRKKYILRGASALMNKDDDPRGKMIEGAPASSKELEQLKTQVFEMQLEIDILRETIDVLKKDPGVDTTTLSNREKAVIVDALKNNHSLPSILKKLNLPKSSYYYQQKKILSPDKYEALRANILIAFTESSRRYGYRRIHALLLRKGIRVSEKVVRRLMLECGAIVKVKRRNRYNSYKGEISPSVPNILERNFHSDAPNHKWVTDITEFAIPAGKVFLSSIVDCFDGLLPAWKISTVPDANMVNGMLDDAINSLYANEHPVVHTDRGCHYRWPGWISRMEARGLIRSMSKKGCSPDNSACEGFFGRVKNELFYNRDWTRTSIDQFVEILNEYLLWYNEVRIKTTLGNMSPLEYRRSLGLAS